MNKRGVFFLVDALIAIAILVVGLVLVLEVSESTDVDINNELNLLSSFMTTITNTQMQELDYLQGYNLINDSMVDPEAPVYIAIAQLYQLNKYGETLEHAINLTNYLTKVFHNDSQYGFYYKVNETFIYNQSFESVNSSVRRVTLSKLTFFSYDSNGKTELFGPIKTEVSLWIR